jgi:hypothetical protein
MRRKFCEGNKKYTSLHGDLAFLRLITNPSTTSSHMDYAYWPGLVSDTNQALRDYSLHHGLVPA